MPRLKTNLSLSSIKLKRLLEVYHGFKESLTKYLALYSKSMSKASNMFGVASWTHAPGWSKLARNLSGQKWMIQNKPK